MLTPAPRSDLAASIPFDRARLDRLMDEENIDLLLATSKHNVQYLLGGHRADFFDYMDATGITRYLPVVIYPKGKPDKASYVGHRLEKWQREANPMWTPETQTASNGSVDAMQKAVDTIKKSGLKPRRIGAEFGFLPYDAAQVLRAAFPDAELADATLVLDRQRAVKSPEELKKLKHASETVLASMQAVIASHGPGIDQARDRRGAAPRRGQSRADVRVLPDHRGREPQSRAVGAALGEGRRTVARLRRQLSRLYRRYLPHGRLWASPMLNSSICSAKSKASNVPAFDAIKPGVTGNEIYAACEPLVQKSRHHNHMDFLAHGMGLVSHEAPRLADRTVAVPYLPEHRDKPLEASMVVSVETTLLHSTRGFIKLEDTVVVTDKGREIYAEGARGWNKGGTALTT